MNIAYYHIKLSYNINCSVLFYSMYSLGNNMVVKKFKEFIKQTVCECKTIVTNKKEY